MSRATATPDNSNINRRDAISVNPREPDLKLRIVFLLIFLSGSFFPSNGMRSISISRARNRVLLLRSQVAGGDRGLQIQTLIAVVGILLAAHAHMSDVDLGDHAGGGASREGRLIRLDDSPVVKVIAEFEVDDVLRDGSGNLPALEAH